MRVAAKLRLKPRGGRRGQVGGHDPRGAPEERERGDEHSAVTDRDERRLPSLGLALQYLHRVWSLRRGLPPSVAGPRDSVPEGLSALRSLLGQHPGPAQPAGFSSCPPNALR